VGSLERAVSEGHRGAVVFVVQRQDATHFRPHDAADPEFGQALRRAVSRGVEVYAYGCVVSVHSIVLDGPLPVRL
jgi:sugar fermentation stimulation protein A